MCKTTPVVLVLLSQVHRCCHDSIHCLTPLPAGYREGLLTKAVDLADRLMPAFDTPSGIPLSWVNLHRVRRLAFAPGSPHGPVMIKTDIHARAAVKAGRKHHHVLCAMPIGGLPRAHARSQQQCRAWIWEGDWRGAGSNLSRQACQVLVSCQSRSSEGQAGQHTAVTLPAQQCSQ